MASSSISGGATRALRVSWSRETVGGVDFHDMELCALWISGQGKGTERK